MSLHINNSFSKKRGIGKKLIRTILAVMLEEQSTALIVLVSLKKPSPTALSMPRGSHHCGVQGRFWVGGQMSVDSTTTRIQMKDGKFVSIVISIPHEALGICQTDQSCHHEVWLHTDFVEQRNGKAHHERHER